MHSLSLHASAENEPVDLAREVARSETHLQERRRELTALQEEFRAFKTRYTQVVGSRLAELAEVEREVRAAEARAFGVADAEEEAEAGASVETAATQPQPFRQALRKLFWSVAKTFHPDHAADEREARRRHAIMAEASRAYREGDAESLHTLLGDEQLQFFCTTAREEDAPDDLAGRLVRLKDELRTVEFGLKRIRQDGLYRLKLSVDEEAQAGRDKLILMAESIERQIAKARRRLAHLG